MRSKKLFVLLPDGVGLRNFAFSSFVEIGKQLGWEVVFWNHTPFDLTELGYKEIKIKGKSMALTDLQKRAKISSELDYFEEQFKDPVYQTYKFPPSRRGFKTRIKNRIVGYFISTSRGSEGLQRLRKNLKSSERKSSLYKNCRIVLEREQPDFVFCTNQRPGNAIAPLTAAEDLGIPTGSFIFSWDNLPKATMIVEPDYYFVWSEYMKQELLKYYPFIKPQQVNITGSPQFEPHYDLKIQRSRIDFYREHQLDPEKEYICYSGDDATTCPDDPQYLEDIAEAIVHLNKGTYNLGILFRRCPVDFSDRYNRVLEKYKDLIVPVVPKWKRIGGRWNTILPTKEDLELQINSILHTRLVVNLASSMVFDFAIFDKPCLYLNYEVENKQDESWSPQKVYNFVHFRSMPSKNAVLWLNSKSELQEKLKAALSDPKDNVQAAQQWYEKINASPAQDASKRIWKALESLTAQ